MHHVTAGLLQTGLGVFLYSHEVSGRNSLLLVVAGAHHEIGMTILRHDAPS